MTPTYLCVHVDPTYYTFYTRNYDLVRHVGNSDANVYKHCWSASRTLQQGTRCPTKLFWVEGRAEPWPRLEDT